MVFTGSDDAEPDRTVDGNFQDRWGWFGVMYRLTNGEIANLKRITKLDLLECLTWLTYETDLESQNKVKHGTE